MDRLNHIRRVLLIVLALNIAVTLIKLAVGFSTGALSLVADGFHSAVDSSSNLIGLAGLWVAARPPDSNHPYGHRKYETVATLAIGMMLLFIAWEILRSVAERLTTGSAPSVSLLDIALTAGTFAVNLFVVSYETRQARLLQSELLLADATQTRVDLFVTLSVIVSLIAARFGIAWLDLLVAGVVVFLILYAAYSILKRTSYTLTDALVIDPARIEQAAARVPGVRYVHRARSRGYSDAAFVDVHIKVDPVMSTAQAHAIATEVERRLKAEVAGVVDAVVHVEPARQAAASAWETINTCARAEADGLGLGVHDLHVHEETSGDYTVEMHVEVPDHLALGAAHNLVNELEARLRGTVPQVGAITTHIEPLTLHVRHEDSEDRRRINALIERVQSLADTLAGPGAAHDIQIHRVDGHLAASVHLTLPDDRPITEAHRLADELERRVLAEVRRLQRIVVHVEPPE